MSNICERVEFPKSAKMVSRTKERILDVSLTLFNLEGEAGQSAVDIANALEMSPGNLYYHFKGKEPIIDALFDRFEEEMKIILQGSHGAVTSIEDNWVFTYIVLEEIYDFRFFYRNLGDLLARYPSLAVRFRSVLAIKKRAVQTVVDALEARGLIDIDRRLKFHLIDQMVATLTFWLSQNVVQGNVTEGPRLIHDTVLRFMLHTTPFMQDRRTEVIEGLLDRHRELVANLEARAKL